jgi:hypothetical protein
MTRNVTTPNPTQNIWVWVLGFEVSGFWSVLSVTKPFIPKADPKH